MKNLLVGLLLLAAPSVSAQSYKDSILAYRHHYKAEFLEDARSPLKAEDTAFLRFYKPNRKYRMRARFEPARDTTSFEMPTSSGKTKRFRKYGEAYFSMAGRVQSLVIYQNLGMLQDPKYATHLFLPFKDKTNYNTTYGGGRYIDLDIKDIQDGKVTIDFNKAYNPWCAFSDGYNCPIPPEENVLPLPIKAGEKAFGKKREH